MSIRLNQHPIECHFLYSNNVPTDNLMYRTNMLIEEEERGLANIHWPSNDLIKRKAILKERVKQRRGAVFVKRRVPVEVWEEVFVLHRYLDPQPPLGVFSNYIYATLNNILSVSSSGEAIPVPASRKATRHSGIVSCHNFTDAKHSCNNNGGSFEIPS
ncbi:hypothetical protein PM082_009307 [Marasmius tenuissimus]|nr:hypothetical protein PM082_009307 [Marasmius tenuissimus]